MVGVVCLVLPTSNHNSLTLDTFWHSLYVLSFLHQTTTLPSPSNLNVSCMSCPSYIKPQLNGNTGQAETRCMSCPSYIKPQLKRDTLGKGSVVCLVLPTSNHNWQTMVLLVYSVVCLVLPTSNHNSCAFPFHGTMVVCLVLPTSNHNIEARVIAWLALYVLSFLHQTTTSFLCSRQKKGCMSCPSYIKPQHIRINIYKGLQLYVLSFLHQTTTYSGKVFDNQSLMVRSY